jgi:putative transposase
MSTSTFSEGAMLHIDDKIYTLTRKIDATTWQAEETRTKRIVEFTVKQLQDHYEASKLRFFREELFTRRIVVRPRAPDYSPEQWEAAKLRRSYVMAAIDTPNTRARIAFVTQATWEKLKRPEKAPDSSTVIRWKQKFLRAGRDISALIDRTGDKGNRVDRYPKEARNIVADAIDAVFMKRERGTMQDTLDRAQALVNRENNLRPEGDLIVLPTLRLVRRMIEDIPDYDQCVARYGRIPATKAFRSVTAHRITGVPLERAETDHTQFDLMVVDDVTGMPLGRPWLTACIDDYTRMILGICISFDPPSYMTVAKCLKHAFSPKNSLSRDYPDIENPWSAYGVMRELSMDNGVEFHSESLENACYTLGIETHYSARKTPWFKGKIERWMGSVNGAVAHGNPGTTFSNIFEKDEYDPLKHAVVKYSTLKKIVMKWIADVYHQKPHRGLDGVPPAVMWDRSIRVEDIPIPDDPARLDAILGKSETRTLTHKGIEIFTLFYNSPELSVLRRTLGESLEVEIRVDSSDIGQIIVFSPDKRQMFTVPALDKAYAAGLSEFQHTVCKRWAARENKFSSRGWLEAKLRIAEMIQADVFGQKARTRSRVARYQGETKLLARDSASVSPQVLPAAPAVAVVPETIELLEPMAPPISDTPASPRKMFKAVIRERSSVLVNAESENDYE